MTEIKETLNWFADNPDLIEGLREKFDPSTPPSERRFCTIRLGSKYADSLNPGDLVGLSIGSDPNRPCIYDTAQVESVKKTTIYNSSSDKKTLEDNIGAKTWFQVLADMKSVYGEDKVSNLSTISIIQLVPKKAT